MFTTEFGAELRVKYPQAILFHKHSKAAVVSDVSVCTGEELSPSLKQRQTCICWGKIIFHSGTTKRMLRMTSLASCYARYHQEIVQNEKKMFHVISINEK